jgi:hypothetical protein
MGNGQATPPRRIRVDGHSVAPAHGGSQRLSCHDGMSVPAPVPASVGSPSLCMFDGSFLLVTVVIAVSSRSSKAGPGPATASAELQSSPSPAFLRSRLATKPHLTALTRVNSSSHRFLSIPFAAIRLCRSNATTTRTSPPSAHRDRDLTLAVTPLSSYSTVTLPEASKSQPRPQQPPVPTGRRIRLCVYR